MAATVQIAQYSGAGPTITDNISAFRLRASQDLDDDTTNAVSIRRFFARVAGVATTERTREATIIQTRHRIPEQPLHEGQVLVYQVPMPEPLFRLGNDQCDDCGQHIN